MADAGKPTNQLICFRLFEVQVRISVTVYDYSFVAFINIYKLLLL
jgi:hypothetical protein